MRFNAADTPQAPTRHRVFDHFGFDVNDHAAFVKRLETMGIKLDSPVAKGSTGNTITYITDPWGARIEIVQRLPIGPRGATDESAGSIHLFFHVAPKYNLRPSLRRLGTFHVFLTARLFD